MPYAAESIVVTAAREAKKIWPFLTGMAVVGAAVVKVTAAATPEVRRPSSRLARWVSGVARDAAACDRGPLALGAAR